MTHNHEMFTGNMKFIVLSMSPMCDFLLINLLEHLGECVLYNNRISEKLTRLLYWEHLKLYVQMNCTAYISLLLY